MFVPPTFTDFDDFERWSKDVCIWQSVTNLDASKQGGALYLSLDGKIREYCSNIPLNKIMSQGGLELIVQALREQSARRKKQNEEDVFAHYESFSSFSRPTFMNMVNYVNEFERLYNNIKHKGVCLPDDVLVYHLLNSASVSDDKKSLWKSILPENRLLEIKKQVGNIFNYPKQDEMMTLKDLEESMQPQMTEEYDQKQLSLTKPDPDQQFLRTSQTRRERKEEKRKGVQCSEINRESESRHCTKRKKSKSPTKSISDSCTSSGGQFLSETFNSAVLDSGCSTTVCGTAWLECYNNTLSNDNFSKIIEKPTDIRFKFADGKTLKSHKKVLLPAQIGGVEVMIETDVVDSNIPLLLSKESLKCANTTIDFSRDEVVMLDQTLKLNFTSSGHCCIPIVPANDSCTTTVPDAYSKCNVDKQLLASKLHEKFDHAASEKVIECLKDSGIDDEDFFRQMSKAERRCMSCRSHKKHKLRPVVHFALAKEFNKVVAIDVVEYKGVHLLHVIDHSTRLSVIAMIHHFHNDVIIDKFQRYWINIFQNPQKIVSHSRTVQKNLLESLGNNFDAEVLETQVDSNIIQSNTALIYSILKKIEEETDYPLEVAIMWAVSAKNTLKNVYGFSPNQLVFGKEINFPLHSNQMWDNKTNISKEIAEKYLQLLFNSRQLFLEKGSFLMMAREASLRQEDGRIGGIDISCGSEEKQGREPTDSFTAVETESWSFTEECENGVVKSESWCISGNEVNFCDPSTEIDTVSDFDDDMEMWSDDLELSNSVRTYTHTND